MHFREIEMHKKKTIFPASIITNNMTQWIKIIIILTYERKNCMCVYKIRMYVKRMFRFRKVHERMRKPKTKIASTNVLIK